MAIGSIENGRWFVSVLFISICLFRFWGEMYTLTQNKQMENWTYRSLCSEWVSLEMLKYRPRCSDGGDVVEGTKTECLRQSMSEGRRDRLWRCVSHTACLSSRLSSSQTRYSAALAHELCSHAMFVASTIRKFYLPYIWLLGQVMVFNLLYLLMASEREWVENIWDLFGRKVRSVAQISLQSCPESNHLIELAARFSRV